LNKESALIEISEARPATCEMGPGLVIESEGRGSWTWRLAAEAEAEMEAGAGQLVSEVETTDDPTVAVVQPVTEKKSASERTVAFSSTKDS
jgi:hypothetical protein